MKHTSQRGIDLIKRHEGLSLEAYLCPANKWTIGYGHTRTAHEGDKITERLAEELLKQDLKFTEIRVNALTADLDLKQNQFDALVSFAFNVGCAAFAKSTLLKRIREGADNEEISKQFNRWVYAGGKKLNGLIKRRQDEANEYLRDQL